MPRIDWSSLPGNSPTPWAYLTDNDRDTDAEREAFVPSRLSPAALRDASVSVVEEAAVNYVSRPVLPTDGSDAGPALQAALDEAVRELHLPPNQSFLIDSPVFLDNPDRFNRIAFEMNGSTFILGPNLPTVPQYTDPTVQWAFFANTKRSAYDSATRTVAVTDATRATSGGGGGRRVTFRNGTHDGQSSNRGFAYGNWVSAHFVNWSQRRARRAWTWAGYADGSLFDGCHNREIGVADSYFVDQIANGDGIVISGIKADGSLGGAKLTTNNGVHIPSAITAKFAISKSRGVVFTALHQEADINVNDTAPSIAIANSQVRFDGSIFYRSKSNMTSPQPVIAIDDSAADTGSDVEFNGCRDHYFYRTGESDLISSPLVYIAAVNTSTRLRFRDTRPSVATFQLGGVYPLAASGPTVTSAVAAITTALSTRAARQIIATGNWELSYRGTAWAVTPLDNKAVVIQERLGAPTLSQAAVTSDCPPGTLGNSSTLSYTAAMRDANGNYTTLSAEVSATVDSTGSVRLLIDAPNAGVMILWRKTGSTGVAAGADLKAELNVPAGRSRVYDTGAAVGGLAWVTPVGGELTPNSVADVNRSVAAASIDGVTFYPPQAVEITADSIRTSSTVLSNIAGLVLPVVPKGTYLIDVLFEYDGPASNSLVVHLAIPTTGGGTARWAALGSTTALSEADNLTLPTTGVGAKQLCRLTGRLTVYRPGNVALQVAQGTSSTVATTVYAGAVMQLRRISAQT